MFVTGGSGFAGVPSVILGHNRHIAWGATTNPMDVTDSYTEEVVDDPDHHTHRPGLVDALRDRHRVG